MFSITRFNWSAIVASIFLLSVASDAVAASIHRAAKQGNVEKIEKLIKKGKPIDTQDRKGQTALHYAVLHGHAGAVKTLLDEGAKVDMRNRSDETAYYLAQAGETPELTQIFVTSYCRMITRKSRSSRVGEFLSAGVDPNTMCSDGEVGLHIAAKTANQSAAQSFLETSVPVDIEDDSGYTPLHHAAANGSMEIARLLLENGADPARQNAKGNTPLHLAALQGDDQVVDVLLASHDSMLLNNDDDSPLIMALRSGNPSVIRKLLDRAGPDVSEAREHAKALLYLVREALKQEWNTKEIRFRNSNPVWPKLIYARSYEERLEYRAMISELLDKGADPNAFRYKGLRMPSGGPPPSAKKKSSGTSFMMFTVNFRDGSDGEIVEANAGDLTALQFAKRHEDSDIAELLALAGAK